ncbi:MAG: hypothetical protein CMB75_04745 [Euryarchaeota archaeon]|nr:hypothetical protein [Euryarchaeota archaeon]
MAGASSRDALTASLVIGAMAAVIVTIFSLIGGDANPESIPDALRTGLSAGATTSAAVLILVLIRLRQRAKNPVHVEDKQETAKFLRGAVGGVLMSLDVADRFPWDPRAKIRVERGVLTIDLIGLDAKAASSAIECVIRNRSRLGRLRVITGAEERWEGEHSFPNIRPAVLQRLKIDAESAQWQILQSRSSVVLRPLGSPPSKRRIIMRMIVYGPPMTAVMHFSFRDLAGSGGSSAGGIFGICVGLLLTVLMANHRDRTG